MNHSAWKPVKRPDLPEGDQPNPIDRFLLAHADSQGNAGTWLLYDVEHGAMLLDRWEPEFFGTRGVPARRHGNFTLVMVDTRTKPTADAISPGACFPMQATSIPLHPGPANRLPLITHHIYDMLDEDEADYLRMAGSKFRCGANLGARQQKPGHRGASDDRSRSQNRTQSCHANPQSACRSSASDDRGFAHRPACIIAGFRPDLVVRPARSEMA